VSHPPHTPDLALIAYALFAVWLPLCVAAAALVAIQWLEDLPDPCDHDWVETPCLLVCERCGAYVTLEDINAE
jgi:hypothetical protein